MYANTITFLIESAIIMKQKIKGKIRNAKVWDQQNRYSELHKENTAEVNMFFLS